MFALKGLEQTGTHLLPCITQLLASRFTDFDLESSCCSTAAGRLHTLHTAEQMLYVVSRLTADDAYDMDERREAASGYGVRRRNG